MLNKNLSQKLIFTLLLIFTVSCSKSNKTSDAVSKVEIIPDDIVEMRYDQISLAGIDTGSINIRFLYNTLKVNGKVSVPPQNFATVSIPLGGFVKSVSQITGNPVKKGQVLAVIENQEFVDIQKNYLESRNRLEFAEADYKRHSELYKEDVYSEKNLQQVTAEFKNLKANVSALEQKLALIGINPETVKEDNITRSVTLVSPISGFIGSVNVNTGKSITSTDVLFEIVNTDKLLLELTLFEKDANKVAIGQNVRFFINNETEQHDAVIYRTGNSVNADKTLKVFASVKKGCLNVLPGMYVNAIIELSGRKVATLPSEAVVSFDDKDYIFVFDKNKEENGDSFTEYRIIEVHKGITDGDFTEVILPDGFDVSGAKVVVTGAYNLMSAKKNAGEMAC
jgi:membrane fusion protein, heavy metal efflux system